ncbi:NB-ARC domain-containing protein [Saccharopolyspora sp. ASAGF58]|uniref:NB-ARC domain-containing protein n=1 Tax=Saccharopolyspora sp. ASAGF58 TaxID=2719023 RepID=UPI0035305005
MVHGKQMLILLDNARRADQVRPLLPGSSSCLALVTSRNRLHELVVREGASRISLYVLTMDEAELLLACYLGDQRVAAEHEAVRELIRHCAGLPLALGIVAARAGENPSFPLIELVSQLQDERERLDALDAGGVTGVRSVSPGPTAYFQPRRPVFSVCSACRPDRGEGRGDDGSEGEAMRQPELTTGSCRSLIAVRRG